MSVPELVAAVQRLGVPLGARPNKTVSDAARWEVRRRHIRRVGRGKYAVDRLPRSTAFYMRHRIALYASDPAQAYSRPDNYPRSEATD